MRELTVKDESEVGSNEVTNMLTKPAFFFRLPLDKSRSRLFKIRPDSKQKSLIT